MYLLIEIRYDIHKQSHASCIGEKKTDYMLCKQCLSQDLETGCLKLAIVNFWVSKILRGATIYSYFNHKHVYIYQNKA